MAQSNICSNKATSSVSYLLGGKHVGPNPKVNNMAIGYEAAKYDMILVSDSGIKSKCYFVHHISVCTLYMHMYIFVCQEAHSDIFRNLDLINII